MLNRLFQRVALSFIAYSERRELSMLPRSNVAAPFVSIVHSSSHFPVMISWIRSISFAGRLLPFLELFPLRVIIFQIIGGKLPFVSTSRFFKMDTCQCHVRSAESFQHAAPAKHLKRSSIFFFFSLCVPQNANVLTIFIFWRIQISYLLAYVLNDPLHSGNLLVYLDVYVLQYLVFGISVPRYKQADLSLRFRGVFERVSGLLLHCP